jgi:hypothetical protein
MENRERPLNLSMGAKLLLTGVLSTIVFCCAATAAGVKASKPRPVKKANCIKDKTIRLTLENDSHTSENHQVKLDGDISVRPSKCTVFRACAVTFVSEDKFKLVFDGGHPFDDPQGANPFIIEPPDAGSYIARVTVKEDAGAGSFHYAVTLIRDNKAYTDDRSPTVVVGDIGEVGRH